MKMPAVWNVAVLFWLFCCVLSAPINADVEAGSATPNLTPDEFKAMKGTYFVKFFSPYCGHCKQLAPKWDAAYREVGAADTKGFKWANVDCIQFSDFCAENAISGYPTLRVYRDAKRVHDLSSSSPSELDLQYFAEQFIAIGDKAFNAEYETAPQEMVNRVASAKSQESKDKAGENGKSAAKPEEAQAKDTLAKDSKDAQANSDKVVNLEPEAKNEPLDASQSKTSAGIVKWHGSTVDTAKAVGRWLVLFTAPGCEECPSVLSKWENHDNFARDLPSINWAIVDCGSDKALCETQNVHTAPAIRVFDDGNSVYTYEGGTNSANLRSFAKLAAEAKNFEGFDLTDLENTQSSEEAASSNGGTPELAAPVDEPQYMSGPVAKKPDYKGLKPKISDVVQYTLETLGQPIDDDPGKLIFGNSPEAHHNFRTWSAPNAPPPAFIPPSAAVSRADGNIHELHGAELDTLVKQSSEPWLIKFYSPKCPHCQDLAPVFEEAATNLKGKLNVGAVNCEVDSQICTAENIDAWPTVTIYRGAVPIDPFRGERTLVKLLEYAERAHNAQIYPLTDQEHLVTEIVQNMNKNVTTYVYLYDESVMSEDWQSLSTVASNIAPWGGKLYRSNDTNLRELAGIQHRGTAFVNVDLSGDTVTGQLKWYDYPYSRIPKRIRNVEEVTDWAYRAKWSSLQYLDPQAITKYSPYISVLLTNDTELPSKDSSFLEHKKMALEFRDHYRERQIQDQDRMRIDRLKQHDEALINNDFKRARHLMQQPLENPVSVDLAFSYIPLSVWRAKYSQYLDTSKHKAGEVVVVDFYHGDYLDEFNTLPIKDNKAVLFDSAELLRRYTVHDPKTSFRTVRKFKKSIPGIPEPNHRSTHFHPKPYTGGNSFLSSVFMILVILAVVYLIYRRFLRSKLRSFAARNHAIEEGTYNPYAKRD